MKVTKSRSLVKLCAMGDESLSPLERLYQEVRVAF